MFGNLDMTIGQLYEKEKDKDDGILYIFYSDMEPFWYSRETLSNQHKR